MLILYFQDIERLAKLGMSVTPRSVQNKLSSWEGYLDTGIMEVKERWVKGERLKYQLVGDNWDKNILPSYRTTHNKTVSLHLFHVIAVIDRIVPKENESIQQDNKLSPGGFIPSVTEQEMLKKELTFLIATSVIENLDQLKKQFGCIYPSHLEHEYSDFAGIKTKQVHMRLIVIIYYMVSEDIGWQSTLLE